MTIYWIVFRAGYESERFSTEQQANDRADVLRSQGHAAIVRGVGF